jgi:hypothetical protein
LIELEYTAFLFKLNSEAFFQCSLLWLQCRKCL